ncbi:MAG: PolC-type DNA polymerase III, partial [Clostridia bacterium]|nr:PolC-type DNA polymerase III [Clostridia bacterium]
MSNAFFEVFHTLELNKNLTSLFEESRITRVVSTSRKDILKIYLESDYLILKPQTNAVEREIKKQIFKNSDTSVKIIEHFALSDQYTPKNLMEAYSESIATELKNYNHFDHNLFLHATIEYPEENQIRFVLEDTIIARKRAKDFLKVLDHIINMRCGLSAELSVAYKEAKPSKASKMSEIRMQEEINTIALRAEAAGSDEHAAKAETKDDTVKSQSSKGKDAFSSKRSSYGKKEFRKNTRRYAASDNPDVIYGREFEDELMPIEQIIGEIGEVAIHGKIIRFEKRELKSGKFIFMLDVTDYTDTISAKIFVNAEQQAELSEKLKEDNYIKLKGVATLDTFSKELSLGYIVGIMKSSDFTSIRMDHAPEKRVELHCHTKMSDMDGVSDVSALIDRAVTWGHKALAVTDHGVVQAFTDAFHHMQKKKYSDFKIIYGMEGYLVDDLQEVITNAGEKTLDETYVCVQIKTTGASSFKNKIICINAVKIRNGAISESYYSLVNPQMPIPFLVEKETGINDSMVVNERMIDEVLPEFLEFAEDAVLVAQDVSFGYGFLEHQAFLLGREIHFTTIDATALARIILTQISKHKIENVAKELKIPIQHKDGVTDEASMTAEIFIQLLDRLKKKELTTFAAINEFGATSVDNIMKQKSYHIILLAQNEVGRVNLYRLVSFSHLKYFHSRPRIPKSLLSEYREGLIIGSACEQGELFRAIVNEKPDAEIARIVHFYDYLEIQPIGNNEFMLRDEKFSASTRKDLEDYNRRIVKLGEEFKKPVVATCDVHFMDPEDEVYRRIIMAGKGFKDADMQAPLFLRTTEEMLLEFQYLGSEKAEEVVIKNTNVIADMIEYIEPVRPDKCPPVIENSDKTLTDICYKKAHEIYGENLPIEVTQRLEKELNSIIKNGFAVMYIIAQKLVWDSVDHGYLVGSRGSVGSSFVATMAGITEVNPLSPHYYCAKCHYNDFTSDEVKAYAGRGGCDMPDKKCPVCGELLKKDGFDIPFETFLGFKGDKEPDIDLNFSGDYQGKAHRYTSVIFGEGHTFKAGTIGTLAEKTAYGFVQKYYEERGVKKRSCEINRIAKGCTGIRRTTGQHPGGIIVLPHGEEIHSFTPIQHPANDMSSDIITTHFDYHSIDHNLLKLDILGHDDPTMIRMLQDLTGTNPQDVPLDDKDVMSLFMNTDALGIKPSDIGGCPLGSLGIPEFGTDFVIQMLLDAKPTSFSDLIRIAGLGHGTDVWLGNAQTLIMEGKATISTAICTRDDIMLYLIGMGVESSLAFTIMESVRKGKGLKPEWEEAMKAADVPDWYIWSCKKIQYMFPKAHAAAYVMMAWRIAYYKVNYPLAYYAAYLSIRATSFNYEL